YVNWEEVNVSRDKGRREVHYYLKRRDGGGSDLAVIGKEKSLRHMSYHYVIKNRPLFFKLKSRRDVINCLNSIISESSPNDHVQPDVEDAHKLNVEILKEVQLRKQGHYTAEVLWLGSSWMCRKKRTHYQSFCRNGVKISVHDFVYVLAEEDKRLVAYLEDMYEDSRENKMVVVRWFHKIDEVGIVLPHNCNDREIFFSLCLQDLSIECIDGLAIILSPQHYEKFVKEAAHTKLQPFVCYKQFENDDVKPFDITQVKGYWKQEILRYMLTASPTKDHLSSQQSDDDLKGDEIANNVVGIRPRKRHRYLRDDYPYLQCTEHRDSKEAACMDCKSRAEMCSLKVGVDAHTYAPWYPQVGFQVEVFSQDSGIRGCWFRALIIKKHKDKVKVQYQDIQDAADESKKLEEWILASRLVVPDQLGIWVRGRKSIRPSPQLNEARVSCVISVGTIVDVWWNDGWWEGIVVRKESEDRFHVFFPGEKKESMVSLGDLRQSREWLGNGWTHLKGRPDFVSSILQDIGISSDAKFGQAAISGSRLSPNDKSGFTDTLLDCGNDKGNKLVVVPDLSKDNLLAQLKWKSSRKRRRCGSSAQKGHYSDDSKSSSDMMESSAHSRILIPTSLKVDHENCKYMGDSLFGSSVVPPLTSLVMSR
ncbi:BAH domain-containing protein/Agenet domain-containing protein, partial [Cephalotus follicularis]